MRLLLVRHGESICGVDGVVGGERGCTGLTDRGKAQAAALRERWEATGEVKGAVLYASTLPRAIQTAEVVAPATGGTDARLDDELCELIPGEIDGGRWDEWTGRFDPFVDPWRPISPGGDSWHSFRRRVRRVLNRFANEHRGETVVACCHGGIIFSSMHDFLRVDPRRAARMHPDFTSVTEWHRDDGHWRLVRYNDASHIRGTDLLPAETPPPGR